MLFRSVEEQFNARLDFVHVLPTRSAAAREFEMQLRAGNAEMIVDDDTLRHGPLRYEIIAAVSFRPVRQVDDSLRVYSSLACPPGGRERIPDLPRMLRLHFRPPFAKLKKYPYCPAGGGMVGVGCFLLCG